MSAAVITGIGVMSPGAAGPPARRLGLRRGGSGLLLHPGDAYDVFAPDVDVLALPLMAPWAKVSETVDYLRGVRPAVAIPVHDALVQPAARRIYLGHATRLAPQGTTIVDLANGAARNVLA